MSTIPTHLAASLVQGAHQQSHSAKAVDSVRNAGDRAMAQLQDSKARIVESVEDSYEAADDHLTVEKDGSNAQQQPFHHGGSTGQPEPEPEAQVEDGGETDMPSHLDITA